MEHRRRRLKLSILMLIFSLALFLCGKYINGFSDLYYNYVYLFLINTVSRLFSIIPFSVYEITLYSFSLFIIYRIIRYIYMLARKRIAFKEVIKTSLCNLLFYISIFVVLNIVSQGVNSFKSDFLTLSNLEVKKVSKEELKEVCTYYKDKLNELDGKINKDEEGYLYVSSDVKQQGREIMVKLGEEYPFLSGFYPMPKAYIYSDLMSYQLLQGETTFTMEANYNKNMSKFDIPSTICHELSHMKGFNNEYEANYISFLACVNSDNYEYQYSGYMMAYSYAMDDLYEFDEEAFNEISDDLNENVKRELRADILYWRKFKGPISRIYNSVYDVLLKAGGQEAGMASYSAVVKLLVSGYKVQYNI